MKGNIYYSINETIELTGLSRYFLNGLKTQGRLPHIRSGKKIYINVPELLKDMEELSHE